MHYEPAVWLPAVRAGTGTDVFTIRLAAALERRGLRAEITWLPLRAEYAPWTVRRPKAPTWANLAHINTWLHPRFYAPSGLPVLATSHGCVHDPALQPYKSRAQALYHRAWVYRLESRNLARAQCVTAVSQYTASRLHDAFGSVGVEVVPNWLPEDAFHRPTARVRPHQPFRLLYVGTWSRRKGSDLLPQIMARLGPDFELWFTSKSPPASRLPGNMRPLEWTSSPEQVRKWMLDADALIFPSRMEGLPLAVLEALACGLPVIASNSASLPEIIRSGENGLLCAVDDTDAFVSAARNLKGSPDEWLRMRTAAFETARSEHTEVQAIDSYCRLYLHLLDGNPPTNTLALGRRGK
jgi:glycosyltransferase involved in cell wall biosynthesis